MSNSDYLPTGDHDFLIWSDHFVGSLTPEHGVSDADLATLKEAIDDFHLKTDNFVNAAALSKKATVDRNVSRSNVEALVRAETRRIKARSNYSESIGVHLGIQSHQSVVDATNWKPDLGVTDQKNGNASATFSKLQSDGIRLSCRRDNDPDWVKLDRVLFSPYMDTRPLLQAGKPELRRYKAIYMLKDSEVGLYSDEVVISCTP